MKKIYATRYDISLTHAFSASIDIKTAGMYCVEIHVSAKSWWQNTVIGRAFLKKDSATIQLNKNDVVSISKKKKLRADDLWNGNVLKGVTQTVHVIASLPSNTLELSFIVSGKPTLHAISLYYLEGQTLELQQLKTEKRDRAPWLSFMACRELNFSFLSISALAPRSKKDDDDIQLKIDGEIVSNENSKAHKEWYWCGKILKGSKKEFQKDFTQGNQPIRIDIVADGAPEIERVALTVQKKLTFFTKNDVRQYTYKGVSGNEDYNRFDNEIVDVVNEWNAVFNDEYPPPEPLHPNLVKAILYQESRVGYDKKAGINIMQVGNTGDPSLKTLRGELKEYWIFHGELEQLRYDAHVTSIKESIRWGVRWLYHKAQNPASQTERVWVPWKEAVKRYGPGKEAYIESVWTLYVKGLRREKNRSIIVWSFSLLLFAIGYGAFVASHAHASLENSIMATIPSEERPEIASILSESLEAVPSFFWTIIAREENWWEDLKIGRTRDNGSIRWLDIDHEPTEQSIMKARFISLKGFAHPIIEVFGKAHNGNGALYLYEIFDDSAHLFLRVPGVVDSYNGFPTTMENFARYGYYGCGEIHRGRDGALQSTYRDINNDGVDDIVLQGIMDVVCEEYMGNNTKGYAVTREKKVESIPVKYFFLWDKRNQRYKEMHTML